MFKETDTRNGGRSLSEEAVTESGAGAIKSNYGYEEYKALGGIINEVDYARAIKKAEETASADEMSFQQARVLARSAEIEILENNDPRVVLYSILRNDQNISGAEYHHSQMSDQKLFAEALRISGDEESLGKFTDALPHIFSKEVKE
jgi:hypothetical protein